MVGTGARRSSRAPRSSRASSACTCSSAPRPGCCRSSTTGSGGLKKSVYRRVPRAQRPSASAATTASSWSRSCSAIPRDAVELERDRPPPPGAERRRPATPRGATPSSCRLQTDPPVEIDYSPAITSPNVEVVTHGVEEARERLGDRGRRDRTRRRHHHPRHRLPRTDPPIAERVRGRDGNMLSGVGGKPEANLGTKVAVVPDAFLTIGPNPGNGHSR